MYTIGGLAAAVGVPTSTVRYYERRGLLRPHARSRGNYRLYGATARERLQFIRSAQAAGLTLTDISFLLRFRDGDPAPCRKVQDRIVGRLTRMAEQVAELNAMDAMLRRWLRACRRFERTGKCAVLEGLVGIHDGCCETPEEKT